MQRRTNTAWCWDTELVLNPTTENFHEVLVDGIWIGSWCLLIAVTKDRRVLAWQVLAKLTRNGTLFTFITHDNVRTESPLEDGINNGIRHVLRSHRGMSEAHMKRSSEWFFYLHDNRIEDAYRFIPTNHRWRDQRRQR